MSKRALIERRPWLLASIASAVAFIALQSSRLPGLYLLALAAAPFVLLAVYALQRHRGRDTRLLAVMLVLEGIGLAISSIWPTIAINALLFGYLAGLSLFLSHRIQHPDPDRRVAAAVLLLGTPVLCWVAIGMGLMFYGLALGGMAASAWISTFPRSRAGVGAVLIVVANVLGVAVIDGALLPAILAWGLFYVGNVVLATGVTGELIERATGMNG